MKENVTKDFTRKTNQIFKVTPKNTRLTVWVMTKAEEERDSNPKAPYFIYLPIIPRVRVGYEMLDSQLISSKGECNNRFIKKRPQNIENSFRLCKNNLFSACFYFWADAYRDHIWIAWYSIIRALELHYPMIQFSNTLAPLASKRLLLFDYSKWLGNWPIRERALINFVMLYSLLYCEVSSQSNLRSGGMITT